MQKLDNRPERPTRFDFGLLLPLWALLEERSVSRAGVRLGLSQPAMSRKFQRLRIVFRDKLLVRSGMGTDKLSLRE
jgi:DNA-binding transcriptional LysR family regulator